jgi:hypothetical protein
MTTSSGPTCGVPATIFRQRDVSARPPDADDGHRLVRFAAHREAGAGHDRRDADHLGVLRDLDTHLLPLVDRAQLLRARLHAPPPPRFLPAQRPRHRSGGRIEIGAGS